MNDHLRFEILNNSFLESDSLNLANKYYDIAVDFSKGTNDFDYDALVMYPFNCYNQRDLSKRSGDIVQAPGMIFTIEYIYAIGSGGSTALNIKADLNRFSYIYNHIDIDRSKAFNYIGYYPGSMGHLRRFGTPYGFVYSERRQSYEYAMSDPDQIPRDGNQNTYRQRDHLMDVTTFSKYPRLVNHTKYYNTPG